MSKNPYKPEDEGRYLSWDHGYNSGAESDCPYDPDDKDTKELRQVWVRGYRANFKNKKTDSAVAESVITISESDSSMSHTTTGTGMDVKELPTEILELELKRRKLKDLQVLHQTKEELSNRLNTINMRIQRLEVLLGE